ncbi:hypothetical protein PO909_016370 [Leuciscus waleckii]
MKAVIIIFITLCLISGQVLCFRVFGCTGGSLMFKCMYKKESKTNDQHKVKYFCRDRSCKMAISTDFQSRWVYNGRFALYDDENSRFFTVFIRNLNREDDGEYTCGNNQTWSHNVTLVESKESRCGKSVIRDGYLGQKKITFRCEYDEKFKTHTKVFYRLNKDPVHVLNSSRSSQSSENFILSDSHKDHFTVTIRDISAADGGVYLCGVERDESDHRPSETSITHITFIKEIQLNVYVPPVVGREGDSSEIKCSYDENHSTEIKHLCKGKCFTKDAQNIISSDKVHVNNPKISVKDDTELNLFTVTLSDLTAEDAGIYWCAVKEAFNLPIELLIVLKDALFTHEASVGGSVSISCKNVRTQTQRLFCRGDQPNICVRDGVRVSSNTRTNGRFSLTDETSAGVFTVNISNLTEEDSGKYWCAEETSGSFVFTEVHLHVTQGKTSFSTMVTKKKFRHTRNLLNSIIIENETLTNLPLY